MEETITPEVEEIGADQTDIFDGWDSGETEAADQPAEETQEEAVQQEDGTPADGQEEPKPQDTEQKNDEPNGPFLTLKYMDETKSVTREEAIELAQKGMNYDRVKTERDSLRAFRADNQDAIDLIRSYAEKTGMTIPEYVDFCRTQDIMREKQIGEDEAKERLSLEKREMAVSKKEAEQAQLEADRADEEQKAQSDQERVRREVQQFLADYPDVKPEEVPSEVFEIVERYGCSLSVAYGKWRIAKQDQELSALRAQSVARQKSPGSLSGSVTTPKRDPAFDGWDE